MYIGEYVTAWNETRIIAHVVIGFCDAMGHLKRRPPNDTNYAINAARVPLSTVLVTAQSLRPHVTTPVCVTISYRVERPTIMLYVAILAGGRAISGSEGKICNCPYLPLHPACTQTTTRSNSPSPARKRHVDSIQTSVSRIFRFFFILSLYSLAFTENSDLNNINILVSRGTTTKSFVFLRICNMFLY